LAPPARPIRQDKIGVNPLVIVTALVVVALGGIFIWLALEARRDAGLLIGGDPVAVRTVEAPKQATEPVEPKPIAPQHEELDPDPDVAPVMEKTPAPVDEHGAPPDAVEAGAAQPDAGAPGDGATAADADSQSEASTDLEFEAGADGSAPVDPLATEDEAASDATPEVEIPLAGILDGTAREAPGEATEGEGDEPALERGGVLDEAPVEIGLTLATPDGSLLEATRHGQLPVIAVDGREAWQVYARPFPPGETRPRIAVVLTGLGLSQAATNAAIGLPGAVSLSFAPYAANLDEWAIRARAAGHEILLDLPMEPQDYPTDDPGPHTLLTSLNPSDNVARLEWLLGRFAGYIGVIERMGTKFARSSEALRPVLVALKNRGLMVVDSRTSETSWVFELAGQVGLARAVASAEIDRLASREAIDRQLAALEQEARTSGYAVAVARPYPVSIERLTLWARSLEDRGFVLAPVSAIANRQSVLSP
jgi:polysaccharide deacetylase 2 family uncharacterized protein YibQ